MLNISPQVNGFMALLIMCLAFRRKNGTVLLDLTFHQGLSDAIFYFLIQFTFGDPLDVIKNIHYLPISLFGICGALYLSAFWTCHTALYCYLTVVKKSHLYEMHYNKIIRSTYVLAILVTTMTNFHSFGPGILYTIILLRFILPIYSYLRLHSFLVKNEITTGTTIFLLLPLFLSLIWIPNMCLVLSYLSKNGLLFHIWDRSTKIPINLIQYLLNHRQLVTLSKNRFQEKRHSKKENEDYSLSGHYDRDISSG